MFPGKICPFLEHYKISFNKKAFPNRVINVLSMKSIYHNKLTVSQETFHLKSEKGVEYHPKKACYLRDLFLDEQAELLSIHRKVKWI